ncbi:MAG TPA: FAD-binding oxidoreductase [Clostridia bacterium]|nr:FAD-binding oxidoreductase [Clostridia bacterium]
MLIEEEVKKVDVLVIGAGLIGCAVAYGLSRSGFRVALVDKHEIGSGASSANFGRIQIQDSEPGEMLDLIMRSASMFPSLVRDLGIDVEYERSPALLVAESDAEWDALREMQEIKRRQGLDVRFVNKNELYALEPYLDLRHVAGATLSPDEARLNPLLYTRALARRSREMGALILENSPVIGFDVSQGRLRGAHISRGGMDIEIRCGAAVICAGAWSMSIGAMVGLEIPVKFVIGEALVTEPVPRLIWNYFSLASFFETAHSGERAVSACCVQTEAGNLLLGEASQVKTGRELPALESLKGGNLHFAVTAVSRDMSRFFPVMGRTSVIRMWRTFAPFTDDYRPVLGASGKVEGLFVCSGFKSTVVVTPVVGELVRDLITKGQRSIPSGITHQPLNL